MLVHGALETTHQTRSRIVQDLLLLAGVLSSMVYVTANILCGLRYPGYRFADQVISELSAIGAPTTDLWVTLLRVYAVLFAAFTIGVVRESVAGAGTFLYVPRMIDHLPTPGVGIVERIFLYSFLL